MKKYYSRTCTWKYLHEHVEMIWVVINNFPVVSIWQRRCNRLVGRTMARELKKQKKGDPNMPLRLTPSEHKVAEETFSVLFSISGNFWSPLAVFVACKLSLVLTNIATWSLDTMGIGTPPVVRLYIWVHFSAHFLGPNGKCPRRLQLRLNRLERSFDKQYRVTPYCRQIARNITNIYKDWADSWAFFSKVLIQKQIQNKRQKVTWLHKIAQK